MLRKKFITLSIVASAAVCSVAMADDTGVNTAVGAVVGALIGNSVSGHHGAVVGGVIGAVVGANVNNNQGYYQRGGYESGPAYAYAPEPAYASYYQPAPVYYPPVTVSYSSGDYGYRGAPAYYGNGYRNDGRRGGEQHYREQRDSRHERGDGDGRR